MAARPGRTAPRVRRSSRPSAIPLPPAPCRPLVRQSASGRARGRDRACRPVLRQMAREGDQMTDQVPERGVAARPRRPLVRQPDQRIGATGCPGGPAQAAQARKSAERPEEGAPGVREDRGESAPSQAPPLGDRHSLARGRRSETPRTPLPYGPGRARQPLRWPGGHYNGITRRGRKSSARGALGVSRTPDHPQSGDYESGSRREDPGPQ